MENTTESSNEESPMIISVYSLSEGIVTDSVRMPEESKNLNMKKEIKIVSSVDKNHGKSIKGENGLDLDPREFLKQFSPFGKVKSENTLDFHTPVVPQLNVRQPSPSMQRSVSVPVGMNSSFKPRVEAFTFPRPPLSVSNPFRQSAPRFSPTQRFTGPGPPPPHVLIRGASQHNFRFPTQPGFTRLPVPHSTNERMNTFIRPTQGQATRPFPAYIPTSKPVPLHTINFARHQIGSVPMDQYEPMQVDLPTSSKPLPPHEFTKSGLLGTQQPFSFTAQPTSNPVPQNSILSTLHPQSIEMKIVHFLRICSSSQSSLQIGQAIGTMRKKVNAAANRLIKESIISITNNSQPYVYILNSGYYDSSNDPTDASLKSKKRSISPPESANPPKSRRIDKTGQELNMDPVSLLSSICSKERLGLTYQVVSHEQRGARTKIVMRVKVGNKVYTATGSNKKDTKKDVSDLALKDILVAGKRNR